MTSRKTLTFLVFIILVIQCFNNPSQGNPSDYENTKINNKIITYDNTVGKACFIKDSLKIGGSYRVNENPELFKKLLIGNLFSPPCYHFRFEKDGKLSLKIYDETIGNKYTVEHGIWTIHGNNIQLKFNSDNKWNNYPVRSYSLIKNNEYYKYQLCIEFDDTVKDYTVLIVDLN